MLCNFNDLSPRMPKTYDSNCGVCRSKTKICIIKFDFKYDPYPIYFLTNKCLLVVSRLNVPVNNFSVMSGRSHRFLGN